MKYKSLERMVKGSIWEVTNWPNNLVTKFLNPLLYLLVFGIAMGAMLKSDSVDKSYLFFLFPGLLCIEASNSLSRAIFMSSNHLKWGMIGLLTFTGCTLFEYLVSMVISAAILFYTQSIILGLVIYILGVAPIISILKALFVASFGLLFWVPVGVIIGVAVKGYMQRDFISSIVVLPLMLTSPAFYNFENAPIILKYISYLNPITYHIAWVRSAFNDIKQDVNILFIAIFVVMIVVVVIAARQKLGKLDLVSNER